MRDNTVYFPVPEHSPLGVDAVLTTTTSGPSDPPAPALPLAEVLDRLAGMQAELAELADALEVSSTGALLYDDLMDALYKARRALRTCGYVVTALSVDTGPAWPS